MKYVKLADNTIIENCNDSTTSNEIFAVRDSYANAGAVRDIFTSENAAVIKVFNESDEEITFGADLVLLPGCQISEENDNFVCYIQTRRKTENEIIREEITELQEVVLEEA